MNCFVCHQPIDMHGSTQARACLDALAQIESMQYCRLTGPKQRPPQQIQDHAMDPRD